MNAACIDPPVVEIEQRADGDRVVDGFIGESHFMKDCDVRRLNGNGIVVHFSHKPEQGLLRLGEQRGFYVGEHARNQFRAAQQFRRDRGVRFRSKRALVQL